MEGGSLHVGGDPPSQTSWVHFLWRWGETQSPGAGVTVPEGCGVWDPGS